MTIAKVIVDVPARETNRPFDYLVPDSLAPWIEIGSRVSVPFGPRLLQGFVVDLFEETELSAGKLKPIAETLDLIPPLSTELVQLAHWLSETYICTYIAALQAMVPAALKAKYEKRIGLRQEAIDSNWLLTDPQQEAIVKVLQGKDSVPFDTLLKRFPGSAATLRELIKANVLEELQTVKDRHKVQTALMVFPSEAPELLQDALATVPVRAVKQREVLAYFLQNPMPIRLTALTEIIGTGSTTVKALAGKGWIHIREIEVIRDPYQNRQFKRTSPLQLTPEQAAVFETIREATDASRHGVFLLQGVTGSGKTEVYLQAIQRCLDSNKEAIVLVPEISLTPQMVERFKGRFGDEVAVLHSRLSNGERYDEWRRIAHRQVRVAIGARSAVFAPFSNLGLIIIDEEHESSYKQEETPKYHAREVAIERAKFHQAVVILGSATPSLESYVRTTPHGGNDFQLLEMKQRVEGRPLPDVHVIDMREELKQGNRSMFSRPLYQALAERLQRQEQSVLLLNRRGYSTFVICRSCGYTLRCPHCEISLTYHQHSHTVRCHYCGYAERQPQECPSCHSPHIRYFGTGTQRVEEELGKLFPGIRVIRMDVDTTSEKGSHEKWLTQFQNRQADVLLGTQMVAKGLDFPYVTLVGVIAADTVLHLPDFRASERTFQLLTQVAGRAGRHSLPGEVFVQTYSPEHFSIDCASRHDFTRFHQLELATRQHSGYPPFVRLSLVTLSHEQLPLLVRNAESFATRLKELIRESQLEADVLGPVAASIPRIKDRYRFQCMVKYRGTVGISAVLATAVRSFDDVCRTHKLQISVDVDPQYLM